MLFDRWKYYFLLFLLGLWLPGMLNAQGTSFFRVPKKKPPIEKEEAPPPPPTPVRVAPKPKPTPPPPSETTSGRSFGIRCDLPAGHFRFDGCLPARTEAE